MQKNMENNQNKSAGSKKIWILVGVLVVIVIIAIVTTTMNKKAANLTPEEQQTGETSNEPSENTPEEVNLEAISPALKDAKVMIPGASPVKDNKVLTMEGKPVVNSAVPMAPEAPQQTAAIDKKTVENDSSVIKLSVSAAGYVPNSFEVKKGAVVNIAVTSTDSYTHIFAFRDAGLSAVAVGLAPGETRAITFNAPDTAGSYEYYCNVPGHAGRGETGTMIVK